MVLARVRPSVAMFVRAHAADEKTIDLIRSMEGGEGYDLFVCANETSGPIMFPTAAKKISTRLSDFADLGLPSGSQYNLLYLSDIIFTLLERRAPGYLHYALVEYDMALANPSASSFFSRLAVVLGESASNLDLVGVGMGRRGPEWMWTASAARRFGEVFGTFFPLVVLSGRAIPYLLARRLAEREARAQVGDLADPSPAGVETDWVFSEAFVPSALHLGGFAMADMNDVIPGSWRGESFHIGPPLLLQTEAGSWYDKEAQIVHPVCGLGDTLRKQLFFARATGAIPRFIEDLDGGHWPGNSELLADVRAAAVSMVKAQTPESSVSAKVI